MSATILINSIIRGSIKDAALNKRRVRLKNSYNAELIKIYELDDKTVSELNERRDIRQECDEYREFIKTYYNKVRDVLSSA